MLATPRPLTELTAGDLIDRFADDPFRQFSGSPIRPGITEFAVVVSDAYQRQGLGRHLMQRLIDIARERGVRRLVGQVLVENTPMLHLMRSLGFSPPVPVEDQIVRVELDLTKTTREEAKA